MKQNVRVPERLFIKGAWAAVLLGLASLPAVAQDAGQAGKELLDLERNIKDATRKQQELEQKSGALETEITSLRADSIAVAAEVQTIEQRIDDFEVELAGLGEAEANAEAALKDKYKQHMWALAALERIARHPPEAMIAQPTPPGDLVRSAILLRSIVPRIEQQTGDLRQDLANFASIRQQADVKRGDLANALARLEGEKQRLDKLIVRKKTLVSQYSQESDQTARRIGEMTRKAESLQDLVTQLEQDRARQAETQVARLTPPDQATDAGEIVLGQPARGTPMSKMKGKVTTPASGRVTRKFGVRSQTSGATHKGVTLAARPGAQVVSPHDGQVVFAGPFRGYRQLLIIDHGEGYHSLLTGMARIDTVVGQWLLGGEPVGLMGPGENGRANLYVEMRKDGKPFNPSPWMTQRKRNARG